MEIKKELLKFIDVVIDKYFSEFDINIDNIKEKLTEDIDYILSKRYERNGINALIFYRVTRECVSQLKKEEITNFVFKIKNISRIYSTSYISPFSYLECPVFIGDEVFIDKNYKIGKYVVIENKCYLIDNNIYKSDNKLYNIQENVLIENSVKVYNSSIGVNAIIGSNSIIREDISNDVIVDVISELQIKKSAISSRIPSQELKVYGVVPKYKNSFVLYGEGIYNPKVKLVVQNNISNATITYWDKNKIIVRVEYFAMSGNDKSKLILFSNGQRIVLNNSVGLQKTLKNLQK